MPARKTTKTTSPASDYVPLTSYSPTPMPQTSNQTLLTILLLISVFANGILWTKVQAFEKGALNPGKGGGNNTQAAGSQPAPQFGQAQDVDKLRNNDHVRGNRNARILLIEYSDLECPFCKRFHPTAKQIVEAYNDKGQVAWVYRHYPIQQLHSQAPKESEAVECARELGGEDSFWKLTDKIYEVTPSNNGLNLADLPKLAGEVGLNQARFKTCLDSGKYKEYVQKDFDSGAKAGVTGTPGNILLDTKTGKAVLIPGALPFESFKTEIDAMLQG